MRSDREEEGTDVMRRRGRTAGAMNPREPWLLGTLISTQRAPPMATTKRDRQHGHQQHSYASQKKKRPGVVCGRGCGGGKSRKVLSEYTSVSMELLHRMPHFRFRIFWFGS